MNTKDSSQPPEPDFSNQAADDLVTICISHYNRLSKLKETISRIYEQTPNVFRIRIFNDGYMNQNIDSYLSEIEKKKEITVIRSEENVGPVASRHHLLKDIETPFVLTLDDDMYVDSGWLEEAIAIFQSNQDIGFIGFPFTSTTSEEIPNTRDVNVNNGVVVAEKKELVETDSRYTFVDEVATGAMMLRSKAINHFQFDPSYKLGFGDIDKTLQILESDWKQVVARNQSFTHDKKSSESEYDKGGNHKEISESYQYFVEKWSLRYPLKEHIMYNYIYRFYPICLMFLRKLWVTKN